MANPDRFDLDGSEEEDASNEYKKRFDDGKSRAISATNSAKQNMSKLQNMINEMSWESFDDRYDELVNELDFTFRIPMDELEDGIQEMYDNDKETFEQQIEVEEERKIDELPDDIRDAEKDREEEAEEEAQKLPEEPDQDNPDDYDEGW
jgi:sugar-specific transcriptional regulator TrmB